MRRGHRVRARGAIRPRRLDVAITGATVRTWRFRRFLSSCRQSSATEPWRPRIRSSPRLQQRSTTHPAHTIRRQAIGALESIEALADADARIQGHVNNASPAIVPPDPVPGDHGNRPIEGVPAYPRRHAADVANFLAGGAAGKPFSTRTQRNLRVSLRGVAAAPSTAPELISARSARVRNSRGGAMTAGQCEAASRARESSDAGRGGRRGFVRWDREYVLGTLVAPSHRPALDALTGRARIVRRARTQQRFCAPAVLIPARLDPASAARVRRFRDRRWRPR